MKSTMDDDGWPRPGDPVTTEMLTGAVVSLAKTVATKMRQSDASEEMLTSFRAALWAAASPPYDGGVGPIPGRVMEDQQ